MENTELRHWGVKGMRWGVRKYQNKDGTLTEAGKTRKEQDRRDLKKDKRKDYDETSDNILVNRMVKKDYEKTKQGVDSLKEGQKAIQQHTDRLQTRSKTKMDLSSKTDKELRDEINRALLEKQYNDIYAPTKVNKGAQVLKTTVAAAGTALTIASSALGVALAIKELKG